VSVHSFSRESLGFCKNSVRGPERMDKLLKVHTSPGYSGNSEGVVRGAEHNVFWIPSQTFAITVK